MVVWTRYSIVWGCVIFTLAQAQLLDEIGNFQARVQELKNDVIGVDQLQV